ncbi:MAG: hypothetical protein RBR27_01185 [Bacilli bacterium]|nr:hypothetical protein [Bacilli bacterium]
MKNLSRKLMLSIVAIALVVIALGTSTFAWFTLSNKASVGQFNAEVTAGEGMELSLDQTTWYSSIPADVIQAKIKANFDAVSGLTNDSDEPILTAVTTADLLTFNKMLADQSGYEIAKANVDYIKLKIYVRAVDIDTILISSLELTGTPEDWTSDAEFTGAGGADVAVGGTVNVSAANGARVGIAGTSNFVYENDGTGTNTVLGNTITSNGQASYFQVKTGIAPAAIPGAPTLVIGSVQSVDPAVEVLTLTGPTSGYYTGEFDLFVWFEGLDPDTYDSILTMPLNIKMSFEGLAPIA